VVFYFFKKETKMKVNQLVRWCVVLLVSVVSFSSCTTPDQTHSKTLDPDKILGTISKRVQRAIEGESKARLPRTVEDGEVAFRSPKSWTSGFFPGMLWMLDSYNPDANWSQHASRYTERLEAVQYVTDHHDLGFMLFSSYGKGYQKNGSEAYKKVLITGANSLVSRYDSLIGMTKSWDRPDRWQYPVIIDNMMNLEYLFWATKVTGDSSYYRMAYSHALNTLRDHYREDNSCYHVVDLSLIHI